MKDAEYLVFFADSPEDSGESCGNPETAIGMAFEMAQELATRQGLDADSLGCYGGPDEERWGVCPEGHDEDYWPIIKNVGKCMP